MRCSRAQIELSAAMDGERLPEDVREHAEGCARCRAFMDGAQRLRTRVRVRLAEPIPDLVAPIMERIGRQNSRADVAVPLRSSHGRTVLSRVGAFAAAALVGVVVGALLVSEGIFLRRAAPASASEIPRQIAAAATTLRSYQATYEVVERNWHPDVPKREFEVDVAFAAPERFLVRVRDQTDYPGPSWPRNDTELRVDSDQWLLRGPAGCVSHDVVTCVDTAPGRTSQTVISGRPPFDADAPMPTDIILPVTTLAGSDRVDVVGEAVVDGRRAVEVRMSAQDSAPLLAFFQQTGIWRPLYPADRVRIWLDAESWFPLRFTVTAAPGEDRALWTSRFAITTERAGDEVLDVRLQDLSLEPPAPASFAVPGGGKDEGFRDVLRDDLERAAGFEPIEPERLHGLRPYRFGVFDQPSGGAVLSYADGLSWLRIRERRVRGLVPVPAFSERVILPGGSVASFLPATAGSAGRRVAIQGDGWDILIESNLRREVLLDVADSLPVRGAAPPARSATGGVRVEQVPEDRLSSRAGFAVLAPATLPEGAHLVLAEVESFGPARAVRLVYGRSGVEPEGYGVRIFQAPDDVLPPASGNDQAAVEVRGVVGRWSPEHQELEWVEDGRYVSLRVPGLELADALALAASLEPIP